MFMAGISRSTYLLVCACVLLLLLQWGIFTKLIPCLSLWTTVGSVFISPASIRIGMSSGGNFLPQGVLDGTSPGVLGGVLKAALDSGADVNGPPGQPFGPIVVATLANDAGVVEFLLEQGADANVPVAVEIPGPTSDTPSASPGERALHIAARSGQVEIVRVLLKRSRADPNATDNKGCTPLFATCESPDSRSVEAVRLLLEAGADPAMAAEHGYIALHSVALHGHMELVDMLYTAAPATLNLCASTGQTALFAACAKGHESVVSRLLSLGAMQRIPPVSPITCPLALAVSNGFVGVVRVLIKEGGTRAVGGEMVLPQALFMAIRARGAAILRLLLTMKREERRPEWVNTRYKGIHLLHCGAAYCCPAAVGFLLEAGADEAARDSQGRIPRDVIGGGPSLDGERRMDRGKEVAIRRMLQRGPAYRARSWAWPSDEEVDASGSGDGDSATASVLSSPPGVKTPPVTGVRIFRPKERNGNKFFVRLVGRYCAKD